MAITVITNTNAKHLYQRGSVLRVKDNGTLEVSAGSSGTASIAVYPAGAWKRAYDPEALAESD